jgi:hypothetical protein
MLNLAQEEFAACTYIFPKQKKACSQIAAQQARKNPCIILT